jgi:hypothetical protein
VIEVPDGIAQLASWLAARLIEVDGIVAVVLGGSWSRGEGHAGSDIDLGLYYRSAFEPDLAALRSLAAEVSPATGPRAATEIGEWGPWVNGGAWLTVEGTRVDWLYRDLDRVTRVVDEGLAGRVQCDYYLGHPHGFHSHYYIAELHYCIVLEDPDAAVTQQKARVVHYPEAMRTELMRRYDFDARFMLEAAAKSAVRGDVFHASGSLFRVAAALVQVLFARERRFCMNEKGAARVAASFGCAPDDLERRIDAILGATGRDPAALAESVAAMRRLLDECL